MFEQGGYKIGEVLGIPIRIHTTLIFFAPLFALQFSGGMGVGGLFWGLLVVVGLFGSVALHELGHSVVALGAGVRVREIVLLPIGGVARLERMPSNPKDELRIAAAGPAVSLALAMCCSLLLMLFGRTAVPGPITRLFQALGWMNFILAAFNLLPSFPMDGGRIFRAWMTPYLGRRQATRIAARTGQVIAGIFVLFALWPPFSLVLLLIAAFVYYAADAEYRSVESLHTMNTAYGFPPPEDSDEDFIRVSPPPYARKRFEFRHWLRDQRDRIRDWIKKSV